MSKRLGTALATALTLLLWGGRAQALNMLYLDPMVQSVNLGEQAFLDLKMNFDDLTLGGGVVFNYDMEIVWLSDIAFDESLPDDPDFRCPGSTAISCPDDPDFLSFGSFDGIVGENTVATLTFDTHALGTAFVEVEIVVPFSDGTGNELSVMATGAAINVVPEPSTFALLGLGGLGLGLLRRRQIEG